MKMFVCVCACVCARDQNGTSKCYNLEMLFVDFLFCAWMRGYATSWVVSNRARSHQHLTSSTSDFVCCRPGFTNVFVWLQQPLVVDVCGSYLVACTTWTKDVVVVVAIVSHTFVYMNRRVCVCASWNLFSTIFLFIFVLWFNLRAISTRNFGLRPNHMHATWSTALPSSIKI